MKDERRRDVVDCGSAAGCMSESRERMCRVCSGKKERRDRGGFFGKRDIPGEAGR